MKLISYAAPPFGKPPITIVTEPIVIASCWCRACDNAPTFLQFPSLYSAIIEVYWFGY